MCILIRSYDKVRQVKTKRFTIKVIKDKLENKQFETISKHQEIWKSNIVLRCLFINTICNKKAKWGRSKVETVPSQKGWPVKSNFQR